MSAGPVLELRLGEPAWYAAAGVALFLAVVAALFVTPLRWPYASGVLLLACGVLWRDWRQRKARARFPALRVYRDLSLTLIDTGSGEIPVRGNARCWISSCLIVMPLRLPSGENIHAVIARANTPEDAFRRLTVLCRFAFAVDRAERHNGCQSNTTGA